MGTDLSTIPTRALGEFPCRKCDRTDFETVRELSEHQIRAHNARIPCAFCSKEASSVQKLVDHLRRRHVDSKLICEYCKDVFADRVADTTDSIWEEYRAHVYKECLKEKIYSNEKTKPRMDSFTMRGRGRCPHGPPVRCKNFPRCPGPKCYYFHGFCRYDTRCIKRDCPFDHTNRPRVCLSCIKDSRVSLLR
ncbi:unnamed protein product [Anisakis simplex]|uniref:C2H2-type domain-containing protein n=1 Tax=Anisakis simplex TaxID=6269 RepID=A0A0M3JWJ8_ANISI|nr:unnamed protein product [Anisakis simplex]